MIINTFAAIFKLGLPVAVLSWFILKQLYARGELDRTHDSKTVAQSIKQIRKERKKNKNLKTNLVQTKWMQFGGGFYGTAALWTFLAIELKELTSLFTDFPGFATLMENGLLNLIVSLLVNQFTNFVAAMVWFTYWAEGGVSIAIWIGAAYGGYLLGMLSAKNDWYPRLHR